MSAEPPVFPKALEDDDDDVAWALQTAHARWERGGHADAVVWLRRAAQSALELNEFGRAADLERSARQIDLWLQLTASTLAQPEEDDGVDSLLEGDMPVLETRALEGPTPSLVDAIEAEARGESPHEPSPEEIDEVEELEDEEIIEEVPASALLESEEGGELPSFPLDSVPPPPPVEEVPVIEDVPDEELEEPTQAIEASEDLDSGAVTVEEIPEKPPSAPLVAVEPEPMPPFPLRESEPPPPLAGFERDTLDDETVTLRPPSAPNATEPEIDPEVADDEILMPDAPESVLPALQASAPPELAKRPEPPGPAIDPERIALVRGLEDLPPEIHAELAQSARTRALEPDEEVGGYGLLWVMKGTVLVMPTIADAVVGWASEGQTVFSRGNLAANVALRAAAGPEGAEVAVWQPEQFEEVLQKCPWVADELRAIADRFQALAGAATGLLGERLDDSMRAMVTDRSEAKLLLGGEVVFEQGKPVVGLYVVGAGELELVRDGKLERKLGPGDLLFPSAVFTHEKAPALARAGAEGAVVLYFERMTIHELVVSVPPLLELIAMA